MDLPDGLLLGEDGEPRCFWGLSDPHYVPYHDAEWGFPQGDDARLFEKICLEGFQSGLSWLTILRKRPAFRAAFADFDVDAVAAFGPDDVERLLQDASIVRHRGKIEATLNNAQRAVQMRDEFGSLAAYFWSWEPPRSATGIDLATLRSRGKSELSVALSKDLKKRGWRFVGPTTVYSFLQAMGLVNDHLEGCCVRPKVEAARAAFAVPAPEADSPT
jgi:DNA-3-methyladenine glycosylase I